MTLENDCGADITDAELGIFIPTGYASDFRFRKVELWENVNHPYYADEFDHDELTYVTDWDADENTLGQQKIEYPKTQLFNIEGTDYEVNYYSYALTGEKCEIPDAFPDRCYYYYAVYTQVKHDDYYWEWVDLTEQLAQSTNISSMNIRKSGFTLKRGWKNITIPKSFNKTIKIHFTPPQHTSGEFIIAGRSSSTPTVHYSVLDPYWYDTDYKYVRCITLTGASAGQVVRFDFNADIMLPTSNWWSELNANDGNAVIFVDSARSIQLFHNKNLWIDDVNAQYDVNIFTETSEVCVEYANDGNSLDQSRPLDTYTSFDDWNDGDYQTGYNAWTVYTGTWSVSNGMLSWDSGSSGDEISTSIGRNVSIANGGWLEFELHDLIQLYVCITDGPPPIKNGYCLFAYESSPDKLQIHHFLNADNSDNTSADVSELETGDLFRLTRDNSGGWKGYINNNEEVNHSAATETDLNYVEVLNSGATSKKIDYVKFVDTPWFDGTYTVGSEQEQNVPPDVNLTSPNGNQYISYSDGNVLIDFSVSDADDNYLTADIYYSTAAGSFENVIIQDLNLYYIGANPTADANCASNNFSSSVQCFYDFNFNMADGNYFIDVNVADGNKSATDSSDSSFYVDNTHPAVTAVSPIENALGIGADTNITATFDEAMDAATISTSTFIVKDITNGTTISGVVTYNNSTKTAKFNPDTNLAYGADHNITITVGAKDLAGNPIDANYLWKFKTEDFYSISLSLGWNLIAVPTVPNDTSPEAVLSSAASDVVSVWTYVSSNDYNNAIDGWLQYDPNAPCSAGALGCLGEMTAGYGYWMNMNDTNTLIGGGSLWTAGNATPPSRTLIFGWNLIGHFSSTDQQSGCIFGRRDGTAGKEAGIDCDAILQTPWSQIIGYTGTTPQSLGVANDLVANKGYWIMIPGLTGGVSGNGYIYGPVPTDVCP